MIRRLLATLACCGCVAVSAEAQSLAPADPFTAPLNPSASRSVLARRPALTYTSFRANAPYSRRSNTAAVPDHRGFQNPGGIGKRAEYYDEFTLAPPIDYHPQPLARFGVGGGPDRNEQFEAQRIGQQRYRNLQGHIDAYGRPFGGYGFGYGLGYGGLGGLYYGYPR